MISTDPSITTNGRTDFGKIYRNPTQDGLLSAFLFGSTSAFDTASGFDSDFAVAAMGGTAFKFTFLRLTGDPIISTAGGSINLGLIAVNGITSGGPGGVLTFAGIRGLLLATQNGSIDLGPEISFSGLHDIAFYARGSGSMLTLASDVTTTNRIRLYGEGGIQLSGDLSTQDLIAFTNGDFMLSGGSIDADTIDISAGGNLGFAPNSSLSIGGDFSLTTRPGETNSAGNITVTNPGGAVIGGALTLLVDNSNGGHIGTGGNISFTIGGDLVSGDTAFTVQNTTGTVNNGGNITLTVDGNLDTQALTLFVENYDSVSTSRAGHIGTGGNLFVTTGGDLTADSIDALINNRSGGTIDSGGSMIFNVTGSLTTQADAGFTISSRFDDSAPNGSMLASMIGSDVTLLISASSVNIGGNLTTDFFGGVEMRLLLVSVTAAARSMAALPTHGTSPVT